MAYYWLTCRLLARNQNLENFKVAPCSSRRLVDLPAVAGIITKEAP